MPKTAKIKLYAPKQLFSLDELEKVLAKDIEAQQEQNAELLRRLRDSYEVTQVTGGYLNSHLLYTRSLKHPTTMASAIAAKIKSGVSNVLKKKKPQEQCPLPI